HAPAVRTDGVLRVRDRHHTGAAGEADRRLDRRYAVGVAGADDAAVGLAAERNRREVRRRRCARAGARAARVAVDAVRVVRLPAAAGPAADRLERAEVRPLGEVGLAENHRAAGPEVRGHGGVLLGWFSHQRERAGAGLHIVAGVDVVLDQHGDAVERAKDLALGAHRVGILGDAERVRVPL